MTTDDRGQRERAYDEHISPLMVQIIKLTKEHRIPFVASFELDERDPEEGPMHCTTYVNGDDYKPGERLRNAKAALYPQRQVADFTVTESDGSKTLVRVIG